MIMERMPKNANGKDLENRIKDFFKTFSDIRLDNSYRNSRSLNPDFIVLYGEKPIAIIEVKALKTRKNIQKTIKDCFNLYRTINKSVYFLIVNVNNEYWYYDSIRECFNSEDIYTLLDLLLNAIYTHADNGDYLIKAFRMKAQNLQHYEKYKTLLHKYLKEDNLLTFGNRVFFHEEKEISFMKELLDSEISKYKCLCKYTKANSFYKTIKSCKFRLYDIAAMNDALETKVIEKYRHLKPEVSTMGSFVHQGFIMCFSQDSTDKLMNWKMYGDNGKGVCYVIKEKANTGNFYFAPVVYVNKRTQHPILLFLNELSELSIGSSQHFHLRLWHIWKYFFKYDYYEGEKEKRLLYIAKKGNQEIKEDWSEEYGITHYIEKDNVPFKIKEVILGPRCANPVNVKESFKLITNNSYPIKPSVIVGYKG